MRYCCLFPETKNIHLTKDIGMIPYVMKKLYKIDTKIACYNNDDYTYLRDEVKGLKLDFIKKYSSNDFINGTIYLLKNSKNIDILNVFHASNRSLLWAFIYRKLNKGGKVYLKMDMSMDLANIPRPFFRDDIKCKIKVYLLKNYVNLVTAETKGMVKFLKENQIDAKFIPNGYYSNHIEVNYSKENTIITVGRIGSIEKRNDLLLEAIKNIYHKIEGWNVKFIGPVDDDFKSELEQYFLDNPKLKNIVDIVGPIYDKKNLNQEYGKAKIFCLTSDWEGFPLVIPEAGKNGDYFVISDVDVASTIVEDENIGCIFKRGDVDDLANNLINACKKCNNDEIHQNIKEKFNSEYYWPNLCKKIYEYLI